MNKLEFTFLTEEQIFGEKQLDILKKCGTKVAMTDFSILLGGYAISNYYTSEGKELKDRTGWWWTKSSYGDNNARAVHNNGDRSSYYVSLRYGGARPALPYSLISEISTNVVSGAKGIIEVEYGEYPQTIVSEDFSRILEREYSNGTINQTGKKYTTDSVYHEYMGIPFQAREHIEYEYNGKKYIRFVADSNCDGEILSDGRTVYECESYWLEVEPITWMIDKKANIALSKYLIFSGVQFTNEGNYHGDFENTDIYRFLNDIFAKDIIPSVIDKTVEQNETVVENADAVSIEVAIEQQKAINGQIGARIQKKEQLQQELKGVQKEQARLLAKEIELNTRISQIEVEIQGKGQYVRK